MAKSKTRSISAEDLYQMEVLSDVRISPEGKFVVYCLQRVDRKTEKKYSNLWMALTNGGEPIQFTFGDQSDTRPRWSPDGKTIAFLSNRSDKDNPPQIFLIPVDGGEARSLTDIQGVIGELVWAPDGKSILCNVLKKDAEVVEREKDEQKKKLGVVSRHYDRIFFKLDDFGYLPKERWHLWLVNVKTGSAKQITDHQVFAETDPGLSADGKWIAYLSNRSEDPDLNPDAIDLFVMPAGGGESKLIETPPGEKAHPSFSPDGRWIAYYGYEGEGIWYKNVGLWIVLVDGSSAPVNLTEPLDVNVSSGVINDFGSPEMMPPTWEADGSRIYFPTACHGSSQISRISVDGSGFESITDDGKVIGSFNFDREQNWLAFFRGSFEDPGQVVLRDMKTDRERNLTKINQKILSKIDLGQIEEVWTKGPDGNDLQGWILKPTGFDPEKSYPSILEIHGGPLAQYGSFFMHEFYFLAANGYVVHFCNPRGGRGYGEEHAKAIWGGWGDADYRDLMSWTDYIAKLPYIDRNRMGVTGGSYGGYMTVWIIGHTHRFKAAVTQRCVSNLVSLWGSSDMNWVFQQILNDKPPFEDLDKFWEHSPIKYIANAKTPTLVIHSENDLRCPIEQGEQVFVALKTRGIDTEMVRFPGEFHGLSRTGRTDRRIVRLNHILRWFDKYLK